MTKGCEVTSKELSTVFSRPSDHCNKDVNLARTDQLLVPTLNIKSPSPNKETNVPPLTVQ